MRILKILSFLFIMGCAEGKEAVVVSSPEVRPVFIGPCSISVDLGCRACLYTYNGRYMIMCGPGGK